MKDLRSCLRGLHRMQSPATRWRAALTILFGAVRVAASLAFVSASRLLVDIATGRTEALSGRWANISLGEAVFWFAGVLALQLLMGLCDGWWSGYVQIRTQNDLRRHSYAHVLRSTWNGRERYLSGDTVNRLEEDIRVLSDLICNRIPGLVVTLLQLVAASVYLLTLAPKLLWLLLVLIVAMVFGSKLFFKTIRRLTAAIRARESQLQQTMQESLQHRVLVLTLIGVDRVLDRFGWMQEDVVDKPIKRLNSNAVARGLMMLGFQAGHAAAFLWGVYGIHSGTVTYGMMTAFLQLVGQVQRPVAEISRQIPAFIHALTSIERLMELNELEEEPAVDPIALPTAPEIVAEAVSYRYPASETAVLQNFTQRFPAGKMTVIVGPTGVGKSTLIRMVLGLLQPETGTVTIGGHAASPAVRGNIIYIPQGNTLLSGTIRDNLLLGDPDATEEQIRTALEIAAADFVYDLHDGLDTKCGEVGSGLSEGQSQRIAVARSLLRKGSVLILDEATSALDAETEQRLLENLHARYHGEKTILFISHREAVIRFADNVIKL